MAVGEDDATRRSQQPFIARSVSALPDGRCFWSNDTPTDYPLRAVYRRTSIASDGGVGSTVKRQREGLAARSRGTRGGERADSQDMEQ